LYWTIDLLSVRFLPHDSDYGKAGAEIAFSAGMLAMTSQPPTTSIAHQVLKDTFGYEAFRGLQEPIIDRVIGGKDALVLMPTGGGKSLCYQIPAMTRPGVGIVISPLIALMQDQVQALREAGVKAAFINSMLSHDEAWRLEADMVAGKYDLLYVAPERLVTVPFLNKLDQTQIALFAIDETHCVSQWGHDFRPEYRKLNILHERFPDVPRIALTATADEPTRKEIIEHLQFAPDDVFIAGFDRPNIHYEVVAKSNARKQLLSFIQNRHDRESGIVYCMSRKKVEQTADWLSSQGVTALPYHAGLDRNLRYDHQHRFVNEESIVIVATIAFGMGIDKPDVRFVAHLDLPKSLEAYYQETGRAGRDGVPSDAWMCYGYGDAVFIRQMVERSEAPAQRKMVEHMKLNALLGYCETAVCRRAVLLRYFGESHNGGCGNCDTCKNPIETFDGTTEAQMALSNVFRTGQCYGAGYLADVLVGADSERIGRNGHEGLSTFGIGAKHDRKIWLAIYRQLVAAGLLLVEPEHGGLSLSQEAKPVLSGQQIVRLRRDPVPVKTKRKSKIKSRSVDQVLESSVDRDLFDALRAKRLELARKRNVPPYVIFHDRTLLEMAQEKPASNESLSLITGVGASKLKKYGKAFLEVIQEHA
jgi:ATP-dependent DNA helicase RecQ